jgi:three-Cys-motif partner protein
MNDGILDDDSLVGPWAREKLDSLNHYLTYYTRRLKKQTQWRKIYVDAFAGRGTSRVRSKASAPSFCNDLFTPAMAPEEEEAQVLKGSPRVALDIPDPFDRYTFIERKPKRITELKALKEHYDASRDIEIKEGDANAHLKALLAERKDWRRHKGVIFLDPWGMHVPWSTIEEIARTGAFEIIINFTLGMAVQRLLARSGKISPARRRTLDSYFGTPDWYDQVYETGEDLAGTWTRKVDKSGQRLLAWYQGRLREVFGYASSEAQLVRNTQGGHLYYLVWAGPHEAGMTGADYILGKKVKGARRRQNVAT